mmetsp:Transcript_34117/g.63134  ORF Transcript_34117/g.63134 Transcript_34117/m.63134 type:complete len:238 (-) Transcript_34117:761-1474(-)
MFADASHVVATAFFANQPLARRAIHEEVSDRLDDGSDFFTTNHRNFLYLLASDAGEVCFSRWLDRIWRRTRRATLECFEVQRPPFLQRLPNNGLHPFLACLLASLLYFVAERIIRIHFVLIVHDVSHLRVAQRSMTTRPKTPEREFSLSISSMDYVLNIMSPKTRATCLWVIALVEQTDYVSFLGQTNGALLWDNKVRGCLPERSNILLRCNSGHRREGTCTVLLLGFLDFAVIHRF